MQKLLLVFAAVLSLVALGQSDDVCEYRLDIVNGSTCAIVNATITIYYKLEDDNNEYSHRVPCHHGPVLGDSCSSPISMTFDLEDVDITFYFEKVDDNKEWSLNKVSVVLDSEGIFNTTFDGGSEYVNGNTTKDIFNSNVKSKNSYMCNTLTKYDMSKNSTNVTLLQIGFENFQAQAFDFDKANEFGSASRCNADIKGSKIVPIAVGAALAGLVIIVLIAYIIGRIRSRKQSSYEALS